MQLCRGRDGTIIGRTSFLCSTRHGQCSVGFWRRGRGSSRRWMWMIVPEWLVLVGIGLPLLLLRCIIIMLTSSLAVAVRGVIATHCVKTSCSLSLAAAPCILGIERGRVHTPPMHYRDIYLLHTLTYDPPTLRTKLHTSHVYKFRLLFPRTTIFLIGT